MAVDLARRRLAGSDHSWRAKSPGANRIVTSWSPRRWIRGSGRIGLDHQIDEIGREPMVLLVAQGQDERTDERIVRQRDLERLQIDDVVRPPGDREAPAARPRCGYRPVES